eukprot:1768891-Prymnesium_polylepis.1
MGTINVACDICSTTTLLICVNRVALSMKQHKPLRVRGSACIEATARRVSLYNSIVCADAEYKNKYARQIESVIVAGSGREGTRGRFASAWRRQAVVSDFSPEITQCRFLRVTTGQRTHRSMSKSISRSR